MTGLTIAQQGSSVISLSGDNLSYVVVVALVALASLVMAALFRREVLAAGEGTEKMQDIARAVQEGAAAYLNRQFRTLSIFVVLVLALLFLLPGDMDVRIGRSVFFIVGAGFSAAIGYLGMWLAVRANVRVAAGAREAGRDPAMKVAFRTGGVVGMATVGLGLLGASVIVLIFEGDAPHVLEGFGLGAAMLAMFMRVGGGIFTKAADVGADLVGKVEHNIPEDDPRNAAVIADNVGDNVGDCAGMAADLFESYAVVLVAALILGQAAFGTEGLVFPLVVPAIGALTAVLGIYLTRPRPGENGLKTINRAFYTSAVVSAILCTLAAYAYLKPTFIELNGAIEHDGDPRLLATLAVIIGIVLAAVIMWLTGYFTGTDKRPVIDVAESSATGPATVVLAGVSLGLESAVYTAMVIGAAIYGAFLLGGGSVILSLFLIALAGTGLLTTVGVIVAMDTFGPVADNAQGIAEMSGDVKGEGAQILTELDAVGNTTKAVTKGIAISTAAIAATALFGSYMDTIANASIDVGFSGDVNRLHEESGLAQFALGIVSPNVLVGTMIGAMVVFLFSGLAISAVGRSAAGVVLEVRRQFREIPGIMEGTTRPEYGRVVDMVTKDAQRELLTPGLLAVMAPIAVGFGLGVGPLAGFLAGVIASGVLMAVFLANSGGAWDNAKKLVEDGNYGGKGSSAHEATVIGDTVGDPFKDTAGPALNPLIKVMNLVALLIAPAIMMLSIGSDQNDPLRYSIAAGAALVVVIAVWISKRRRVDLSADEPQPAERVAAA